MRNGWKAVGIKLNGIFNKNIYVMTDKEKAIALFSESIILQDKEAGAPINELTRCVNTAMINALSVGYDAVSRMETAIHTKPGFGFCWRKIMLNF